MLEKNERPDIKGIERQAPLTTKRSIARRRLWNQVRVSILRGTVFGGLFATILGIMSDRLGVAALTSAIGLGWAFLFYWLNPEDRIYGGA